MRGWCFGDFELRSTEETLWRGGELIPLRPQAYQVLCLLIEKAPLLVTRDRLLEQVWDSAHLSESVLPQAISEIRRALGESASEPRFIETRYGRGYRFLGHATPLDGMSGEDDSLPTVQEGDPSKRPAVAPTVGPGKGRRALLERIVLSTAFVFVIGLATVIWLAKSGESAEPLSIATELEGIESPGRAQSLAVYSHLSAQEALHQGLERLRDHELQEALELLRFASQADPESPMIRWALARAWKELGYFSRALNEAQQALSSSGSLSWEEKLQLRGLVSELTGSVGDAVAVYRELAAGSSPSLDHGLLLVDALLTAGRPDEALEWTSRLRPRAPGELFQAELDLRQARAASIRGDSAAQRSAAERVVRQARNDLSKHLLALGWVEKADALSELGGMEEAADLLRQAEGLFGIVGDRSRAVEARIRLARLYVDLGRHQEAMPLLDEAIEACRSLANRGCEGFAWQSRGWLLRRHDRYGEAEKDLLRARDLARDVGDRAGEAAAIRSLGALRWEEGRGAEAAELVSQSIDIFRVIGADDALSVALSNAGLYRWALGEHREALAAWDEGLSLAREHGYLGGEARILLNRGWAADSLGRRQEARELNDAAADILRRIGHNNALAFALHNAASLALSLGDLEIASTRIGECLEIASRLGEPWLEVQARKTYGYILQQKGLLQRAERELLRAGETAEDNNLDSARADVWVALGRLAEQRGEHGSAVALLQRAAAAYRAREDPAAEASALVALAGAWISAGDPAAARQILGELESRRESVPLSAVSKTRLLLTEARLAFVETRFNDVETAIERDPSWSETAQWEVARGLELLRWLASAHLRNPDRVIEPLQAHCDAAAVRGFVSVELECRQTLAAVFDLAGRSELAVELRASVESRSDRLAAETR